MSLKKMGRLGSGDRTHSILPAIGAVRDTREEAKVAEPTDHKPNYLDRSISKNAQPGSSPEKNTPVSSKPTTALLNRRNQAKASHEAHEGIIDVFGTSHRPAGPWPNSSDTRLVAWMKLEREEYMCKKHESPVDRIEDCSVREPLTVTVPYKVGATTILIDNIGRYQEDVDAASEKQPLFLYNELTFDYVVVIGSSPSNPNELRTRPTQKAGSMYDHVRYVNCSVSQQVTDNQPIYRRNILNYMPSLHFTPEQFVSFDEECLLQNRLSGPVDETSFTWFFIAKGYASEGSSPWPLFTALDTKSGWSFQLQVVIEQRSNQAFEPRWKLMFGRNSEKTDSIDPKTFHIITVIKDGRVARLFIDGCKNGAPAAEFIVEDEDTIARISYIMFGLDANGSKYFDGELAEFMAYDLALTSNEIDSVGKYFARKYDLPWDWIAPRRSIKLDDWMANKAASAAVKRQMASSAAAEGDSTVFVPIKDAKKQVDDLLAALDFPETAQNSLDALANLAVEPRQQKIVLRKVNWSIIFGYLESQQMPTRTSTVRLLSGLCHENEEGKKEVISRDGIFLLLKACQPTWKLAIANQVALKEANYQKAIRERDAFQAELDQVAPHELNRAFQLRTQLNQANVKVLHCQTEAEAIMRRLKSGIEEKNSWDLQRESLKALAELCQGDAHNQKIFTELDGILVLHDLVQSQSVPVRCSLCKTVRALVNSHDMAEKLLRDGLIGNIIRLMFVDDPPLQCEAASVMSTILSHRDLRIPLLDVDVSSLRIQEAKELGNKAVGGGDNIIQAFEVMLHSEFEDNHITCCNCLFVLSTHDAYVRARLAQSDSLVSYAVAHSRSPLLKLRRVMIQLVAYLCLDQTAVNKAWASDLEGTLLELLQDPDLFTVTHALMALGNATRNAEHATKVREMGEETGLVDYLCELAWTRPEPGLQHLVCGCLANLATPPGAQVPLLKKNEIMLEFLVAMCAKGTLHARFLAAACLRKLSNTAANAECIVDAGALEPIIAMAKDPKVIIDEPHELSVDRMGRTLYLHWQAGRAIAAFTKSEQVHMKIYQAGGIFSLVQLCESRVSTLCREGASALAMMAEVKCEPEVLLQMAENHAIEALQALAEDADDSTGSEAIRALSSLLNFDNAWAD